MCSLRFENNLLTIEDVRFASISKKTPLSKLSFAFVSLALPLLKLMPRLGCQYRLFIGLKMAGQQGGKEIFSTFVVCALLLSDLFWECWLNLLADLCIFYPSLPPCPLFPQGGGGGIVS
jgi:hypothetical protein